MVHYPTYVFVPDMSDTFAPESNGVLLPAHESDSPGNGGNPSWILRTGAMSILTADHAVKNNSGSATSAIVHSHIPVSANYGVIMGVRFESNVAGNTAIAIARGSLTGGDGYRMLVQASDGRVQLSRNIPPIDSALMTWVPPSAPTPGATWLYWLSCHDNEKAVYVKRNTDTQFIRRCWSADNTITATGRVGLELLRNTSIRIPSFQIGVTRPNIPAPAPPAGLLFSPNYDTATQPGNVWFREQEPHVLGVQQDRLTIVAAPSGGVRTPTTKVMKVVLNPFNNVDNFTVTANGGFDAAATTITLANASAVVANMFMFNVRSGEHLMVTGKAVNDVTVLRGCQGGAVAAPILNGDSFTIPGGDVNNSGGSYPTNRAEVYDRYPSGTASSVPYYNWPDPYDTTRWYGFSLLVDASTTLDTTLWRTITQWKGFRAGSPRIAIELDDDRMIWGGTDGGHRDIGAVDKGVWHRYVVGIHHHTSSAVGWAEVWRDGVNVLPKRFMKTMATVSGLPDPTYLKQGIYRTVGWTTTDTLYFSPMKVGLSKADVE